MGGIRIRDLEKRFGRRAVLDGLSLEVAPGDLLSILGESGTGKTTLIRAVAGLCPIDAGTIEIGGREAARPGREAPPEDRRVGIVFQDLALWPHMTVWENATFPVEGTWSRKERRRRAGEVLDRVRLPHGHDRYPHEISGGEGRRTALARALVREPEVLLLDEPFSDLELSLRDELMGLVWDFARDRGVAVIHATHIQEEALAFADRLAILHGGRIVQEGTPEEVYRRPVTPRTARLLGEVGVIRGRRVGPTTARTPLGDVTVPAGKGDLLLGVRPEAVRAGAVGDVEGEIRRVRFLGGRTLYQVEIGGECLWATGDGERRAGETVRLALDPDGVRAFPLEKGTGDGDPSR